MTWTGARPLTHTHAPLYTQREKHLKAFGLLLEQDFPCFSDLLTFLYRKRFLYLTGRKYPLVGRNVDMKLYWTVKVCVMMMITSNAITVISQQYQP